MTGRLLISTRIDIPISLECISLGRGEMYHSRMFGRGEIGGLHDSAVKVLEIVEIFKVGSRDKSQIVGFDGENIIDQHPFVRPYALPEIWSLT